MSDQKDASKSITSNPKSWITIVTVTLIVLSTGWLSYKQIKESVDLRFRAQLQRERALEGMRSAQEQIETIRNSINEIVSKRVSSLSESESSNLLINERFSEVNTRIEKIEQQTLGLRQALNPVKPEEIITIARLTDQVVILKKEVSDSLEQIKQGHRDFKESILRELKSSNDSTNLILIVLIPLVINFLYTVWKDFCSGQRGG